MPSKQRVLPGIELEQVLWSSGCLRIAGIDEAGRGPLAGPLCVAAVVVFSGDQLIAGIDDSKKLSELRREALYEEVIVRHQVSARLVSAEVIDSEGIRKATLRLMAECCEAQLADYALVDGRDQIAVACPQRAIIRGDATCYSIACASIVAKVVRDRIMRALAINHPQYGFERNKGYGTAEHIGALAEFGFIDEHRRSFCRAFDVRQ